VPLNVVAERVAKNLGRSEAVVVIKLGQWHGGPLSGPTTYRALLPASTHYGRLSSTPTSSTCSVIGKRSKASKSPNS
jgi:hypothetical protein